MLHLPLDSIVGTTTVVDVSGRNNNGTLVGATHLPYLVQGKLNNALYFDGTEDNITIGGNTSSVNNITETSIMCWIKSAGTTGDYQFPIDFKYATVWAHAFQMVSSALRPRIYVKDAVAHATSIRDDTTDLIDGLWHHVAGTFKTPYLVLYVDGVNKGTDSTTLTSPLAPGTADFSIGDRAAGGYYFKGAIDDVRIYNRALTAAEVLKVYRNRGRV